MKALTMSFVAATFLVLSSPLGADANLIWDWTGDCQRVVQGFNGACGHATLHVVTTDAYVPGDSFSWSLSELQHPTLLEMLYRDDNITFDLAFPWRFDGFNFQLPASPADGGSILNQANDFRSDASGVWNFGSEDAAPNCNPADPAPGNPFCGYETRGINGVWTRVPEPSTLTLLGVGLIGLTLLWRRRVR